MNLFIWYEKCSTCKRAKEYLDRKGISYNVRCIKTHNPTYDELKKWVEEYKVDIKRLFNTSGILYREMGLKDKLLTISDDEKLKLLATNGMLVKRPLLLTCDNIYIGFKEKEWDEIR